MSDKDNKSWFRRHKILTVILVIIGIAIISNAAGGNKDSGNQNSGNQQNQSANKKEEPKVAKIGETARDGKFEFVVKSVECGRPSVGANQYATKTAQGQFCILTVSVKNVGNEAQGFFSMNQKILNAQNQQFAADDSAAIYLDPNVTTVFSNINPGNSVEGKLVFDIPKDQTPATAELHDSAFSSGVKVTLQ